MTTEPIAAPLGGERPAPATEGASRTQTGAAVLGLGLIMLANVAGSLYWISQNVVLIGHDASEYLWTSIEYTRFFTPLSPQSLFQGFTFPAYRTPAIYIAAQPFYWLLGVGMDSAQSLNVLFLAVVIGLTYALGRTIAGRGLSLFAALLVGLLPMTTAMSRLFYTEMLLTAMVVLNLLAMVKSRGFAHRGWSLAWGASLGAGLLVKWTMPIYLWLPLLWWGWRRGVLQAHVDAARRPAFRWRRALIAIGLAALLSSAWFWPNRAAAQLFPLGDWLWLGWFALAALTIYALLHPSTSVSNGWGALLLALTMASLWYLPHANIAARLLHIDEVRGQEDVAPLAVGNVTRYFRYIYEHHLGALAFWTIIPAALAPWAAAWLRRRWLQPRAAILWLSTGGALFVLVLLQQQNARNLAPLLPGLAVLLAIGLGAYPRPLRISLGAVWLLALAVQWSVFTFDRWFPLYEQYPALWVRPDYSQPPSTGPTDPSYWVGPALLDAITAGRDDPQSLGVLVNTHQVHRGVFRYLIAAEERKVGVRALTTQDGATWTNLLASQWVLRKNGDNRNVAGPGLALLDRIQSGDPHFAALYELVERYPLPDGDTLFLYHRAAGPGWPEADPEQAARAQAIADAVRAAWSDHAQLVYGSPELAVWVGMHDPAAERVTVLRDASTLPTGPVEAGATVLAVVDHTSEALEQWLDERAYRAATVGDDAAALVVYGAPAGSLAAQPVNAAWGDVRLATLRTQAATQPGHVLPVEVEFAGAIEPGIGVSLRLLASDGAVVASSDFPLQQANRLGLFAPPQTAPAAYTLAIILYDRATLAPIDDERSQTPTVLGTVQIQP